MIGFLFAILTAISASLKDVFSKKGLKDVDEYVAAWALDFFAVLILLPMLLFVEMPSIGKSFWSALLITGILDSVATILYMKSLKYSDLSVTIPMISFTPLFLLITSPLIIGEFPSLVGLVGVLLVVFGAYFLNINERCNGVFAPFRALLSEKGPKLMLAAAFLWSITANFDKIGISNSSPLFWIVSVELAYSIVLFPVMLHKSEKCLRQIQMNFKALIPIGFFNALMGLSQMIALNLMLVAYVISIKRTGAILGVIFGWLIFKEKGIKERLFGAIIMVLGAVLIALS